MFGSDIQLGGPIGAFTESTSKPVGSNLLEVRLMLCANSTRPLNPGAERDDPLKRATVLSNRSHRAESHGLMFPTFVIAHRFVTAFLQLCDVCTESTQLSFERAFAAFDT